MNNSSPLRSFQPFILLVDADNISPDLFHHIIQKIEIWGTITIRRIYGNQDVLLSQKWKELCLQYALQPIPHIGVPGAKNATDIALTVDAMDLLWLHKEHMPQFCLVTGDQDFTALVLRLRSQGCTVYCIGKATKSEALARACTHFLPTEQFSATKVTVLPAANAPQAPATAPDQAQPGTIQPSKTPPQQPLLDLALLQLLLQAVEKICAEKPVEWITLTQLGVMLKQLDNNFHAKAYGYKNLRKLMLSQTTLFENREQGPHLEVRLKQQYSK